VAVQGEKLDAAYLKHWAVELGVLTELQKLLSGETKPKQT
jgi:hypothetical protein